MDPKDKQIADLTAQVQQLTATIAEKDGIIAQKNQDIVGVRKKYKKLSEMSEEEKAKLTAEELEEREALDEVVTQQEEANKQAEELRKKEVAERREKLVEKYAGADPELKKKVLENFDRIKDADLAYTETEIEPFVQTAVNMLGDARPNPINVGNGRGGIPPTETKDGEFANSEGGKQVASALGLSFVASEGAGQGGEGGGTK